MEKAIKKSSLKVSENGLEKTVSNKRLEVLKTYKIYIGGQFPRTESGRFYQPVNAAGKTLANVCLSSRKDFRDAVVSARGAVSGWSGRAAFNRSQILYRMAEMLEGRKAQFIDELVQQDSTKAKAEKEVNLAIDRLIYYAGWCDKFQQIFSAVNPVASSHFNFSVPEATGVVSIIVPQSDSLLGLCIVYIVFSILFYIIESCTQTRSQKNDMFVWYLIFLFAMGIASLIVCWIYYGRALDSLYSLKMYHLLNYYTFEEGSSVDNCFDTYTASLLYLISLNLVTHQAIK